MKFFDGAIEPLLAVANYDEWSTPATPDGTSSAALLGAQIGIATEPLGELQGLGVSLAVGSAWALGLHKPSMIDWSLKAYIRF